MKAVEPEAETPLCYIVSPSVSKGGNLEIRNNGVPSEDIRARYKAAGLRWNKGGSAWYGSVDAVMTALDQLEELGLVTPDRVVTHDDPSKALALWCEMPKAKARRKERAPKPIPAPTVDVAAAVKQARELADMTGKPISAVLSALAAAQLWSLELRTAILALVD